MNAILQHWDYTKLRLQRLEHRIAPAAFNSMISRTEPTLNGDAAGGPSIFGNDPNSGFSALRGNSISADGRHFVFASLARNLVEGQSDVNNSHDIFVHDRIANTTQLISAAVGNESKTANGASSFATISADGRYVAYASTATDLVADFVPSANGTTNYYRFDRLLQQTRLITHRHDAVTIGAGSAAPSTLNDYYPLISANGQFVAFNSTSTDLVSGFTSTGASSGARFIYMYDALADQATLVTHSFGSSTYASSQGGTLDSISQDGRFVTFVTSSTNLLATSYVSKGDIFRFDRLTGANILISQASNTAPFGGNALSAGSTTSADGRWIAFTTKATNLVPGATMSGNQVVLRDVDTGTSVLVSRSAANPLVAGDLVSVNGNISADGSYVVFTSNSTNLITGYVNVNSEDINQVYLYDRISDQVKLVSHQAGAANTSSNSFTVNWKPVISADNRYVVFGNYGTNLVSGFVDGNPADQSDIFRFDRVTGQNALVSGSNGSPMRSANVSSPIATVSADGNVVAFTSGATDLNANVIDTNGHDDVYVRDMSAGVATLASRRFGNPSLSPGGQSQYVQQSVDGRFIVFVDTATNLVPGQIDAPNTQDIFLFDRVTKTTTLVSHAFDSASTVASKQWSDLCTHRLVDPELFHADHQRRWPVCRLRQQRGQSGSRFCRCQWPVDLGGHGNGRVLV